MIAATPRESALAGTSERGTALRFGDFTLDRATGELFRHGTPVKIPPQPARALQHLAENAGRLVTRRDLQGVLWGDGRHVDFEQGLNYCISQVREALEDSAEASRYIVTVPRRGYRFVATVESAATIARQLASRRRERWWIPALLAVLLFAAAGLWVSPRGERGVAPAPRVAVTPFAAPAAEEATRARVLFEELLVDLDQHGGELVVVASDTAGADLRLEGSLYRLGEELVLALRLVRSADGVATWSRTFRQPAAAADWLDWPQQAATELAAAVER